MTCYVKVTKCNGAEFSQIVETVYDAATKRSKSIAIESFGDLVKHRKEVPNIDALIQQKIKILNNDKTTTDKVKLDWLSNRLPYTNTEVMATKGALIRHYGGLFYRRIWEELKLHQLFKLIVHNSSGKAKINYDLDLVVLYLSYIRILAPDSKSNTFSKRTEQIFNLGDITLDNIYDALSVMAKRKEYILDKLNHNIDKVYTRVKTIAFYDVTSLLRW